jgi:hypothetical protein
LSEAVEVEIPAQEGADVAGAGSDAYLLIESLLDRP